MEVICVKFLRTSSIQHLSHWAQSKCSTQHPTRGTCHTEFYLEIIEYRLGNMDKRFKVILTYFQHPTSRIKHLSHWAESKCNTQHPTSNFHLPTSIFQPLTSNFHLPSSIFFVSLICWKRSATTSHNFFSDERRFSSLCVEVPKIYIFPFYNSSRWNRSGSIAWAT